MFDSFTPLGALGMPDPYANTTAFPQMTMGSAPGLSGPAGNGLSAGIGTIQPSNSSPFDLMQPGQPFGQGSIDPANAGNIWDTGINDMTYPWHESLFGGAPQGAGGAVASQAGMSPPAMYNPAAPNLPQYMGPLGGLVGQVGPIGPIR